MADLFAHAQLSSRRDSHCVLTHHLSKHCPDGYIQTTFTNGSVWTWNTEAESQMMSLFPRLIMVQSDSLLHTRRNDHITAMEKKYMRIAPFQLIHFFCCIKMTFNLLWNCLIRQPHNVYPTHKDNTPFINIKTARSALLWLTIEHTN